MLLSDKVFCDTDIKIILHRSAVLSNAELFLNNIATIEGNSAELQAIKTLKVPAELYSDGYVDRKELFALLQQNSNNTFFIYGNSVRITENGAVNTVADKNGILIARGDSVKFFVKKNGISIEVSAVALNDAGMEDEIQVRIENVFGHKTRFAKGKVKSADLIEAGI